MEQDTVYNKFNLSDAELCEKAQSGDAQAEEALIQRYARLVRTLARPYFLYGGDSEDLMQEGLLGLLNAIREYHDGEGAAFRTFAETCIRNRLYSAIRASKREKNGPLNFAVSLEERPDAPASPGEETPEEQLLSQERFQELTEAISGLLSTLESQVLKLYLQGLSYDEIGWRTKRGAKAADNAVQRIRRKVSLYLQSRR